MCLAIQRLSVTFCETGACTWRPFLRSSLLRTNLLSMHSKYRLLSEALRHTHPPATEESLAEFVTRKFGAEVSDYLVDPFVSTIFFSDPQKLGMLSAFPALVDWERTTGSLVRGAIRAYKSKKSTKDGTSATSADRKASPTDANEKLRVTDSLPTLGSFKNGMGTLTERLAKELKDELRLESPVESLLIDRRRNSARPLSLDDSHTKPRGIPSQTPWSSRYQPMPPLPCCNRPRRNYPPFCPQSNTHP